MKLTDIHPVDSKKHMLEPNDIFIVAAHEYKHEQEQFEEAAQKHGVSAERLLYTAMIELYSHPGLIRLRSGNTLFTIASFPDRVGYVSMVNGDTANRLVENIVESLHAAKHMGFSKLIAILEPEIESLIKKAVDSLSEEGFSMSLQDKTLEILTGFGG
jgi:hypothetical protein